MSGMCRWRRWWKGLPLLVLLIVAAIYLTRTSVEADLTQRSEALLTSIGESWAHARFEGRSALLEGEALSEDARVKVRRALASLSGVRHVEDRTTILPERRPFTFSAIRDGTQVRLLGYVPSAWARRRIAAAAEQMSPNIVVSGVTELVRARGVPPGDFVGAVVFGLAQLAKMPAGRIILSDNTFTIEGRAPDFPTYDALEVIVRSELPSDFRLARFAVLPPAVAPFVWSAEREPGGVRLSGYIPLGDARRALLDMVRAAIPGAAISDQLRLADGAPPADDWLSAVGFALGQLGRLPDGKVSLSDTNISIEGRAPDFEAYDALVGTRRSLPDGFTLSRYAVTAPVTDPFVWEISRTGEDVRLSGYAPSEEARQLVVDAVRSGFPGIALIGDMRVASGGPPADSWTSTTVQAVNLLTRVRGGTINGKGLTLTLSGEARDSAGYSAAVKAAAENQGSGITFRVDVRPPVVSPYVFSLRKAETSLTMSGFYPSADAHENLVATARSEMLGMTVNDVSSLAHGAPEGFDQASISALRELSRLRAGEATFDDAALRFVGTALYPRAIDSIRSQLEMALAGRFELQIDVTARDPELLADTAVCQKVIDDLLAHGVAIFSPNSAKIDGESFGLLDHLVASVLDCPLAKVAFRIDPPVAPHLAAARVQALKAYFEQAGVTADRIESAMIQPQTADGMPPAVTAAAPLLQVIVR